jgi:hypothetical protein
LTALFLEITLSGGAGSPGRRALLVLYSNISAQAEGISFTASETDGAAMSWEGPHKISDYLGNVANSSWKRPPEGPGVYIVSENPWRDMPTRDDNILYVAQAAYLRYHMGRLLCDLLGFTGDNPSAEEAYQHKGGHLLWSHYCLPRKIEPSRLYLGWCSACICMACAETRLLEMMTTGPHRVRICAAHRPVLNLEQNCRGLIPTTPNSTARRQ